MTAVHYDAEEDQHGCCADDFVLVDVGGDDYVVVNGHGDRR